MNIKEYAKNNNLELTEQQIEKNDKLINKYLVWKKGNKSDENKREGDRLPTLGFGIPNLLKIGEVRYFPEQFILDVGLQGMTALEIKRYFMSTGMDIDGDIISRGSVRDGTRIKYFVDFKHNVFTKY